VAGNRSFLWERLGARTSAPLKGGGSGSQTSRTIRSQRRATSASAASASCSTRATPCLRAVSTARSSSSRPRPGSPPGRRSWSRPSSRSVSACQIGAASRSCSAGRGGEVRLGVVVALEHQRQAAEVTGPSDLPGTHRSGQHPNNRLLDIGGPRTCRARQSARHDTAITSTLTLRRNARQVRRRVACPVA
jgi:hypothetical protein